MKEPLPLVEIHEAVLDFLRGRIDVVLFGAHAVNAYAGDPRATQDIDLLSVHAGTLAEEIKTHLSDRFHVAIRIREAAEGLGMRIYQLRKEGGNRHLVDLRQVETLPPSRPIAGIQVMEPSSLIAAKVIAIHYRRGRPKSLTDSRDLALLLLTFPDLKRSTGAVADCLSDQIGAVQAEWNLWVQKEILPEEDDY